MAVAQIGVLDLSVVTDALINILDPHNPPHSPLWGGPPPFGVGVSGSMPEAARVEGGCQLSFYLFHVAQDPYQLNAPLNRPYFDPLNPLPPSAYEIPFLPQPLDLHYLLTVWADRDYHQEQQVMSVAMQRLYDNPIVVVKVPRGGVTLREKFTVTMAVESSDELSRLWQAISAPIRLSAVYKVSVVFLAPEEADKSAQEVERVVVVAPPELPGEDVLLTETSIAATYELPDRSIGRYDLAPAVVAPGDAFVLHGSGLDQPTAARVFLRQPGNARVEITPWRTDAPPSPSSAHLVMPAAGAPAPGLYELTVGSDTALGDPATYESNGTPFSVAAYVDVTASPPLLGPAGGPYSFTGAGFVSGSTEILLAGFPLTEAPGPPPAGQFAIGAGSTAIDFPAPPGIPPGRYALRVRVNGVESRPSWWVDL